LLGRLHVPLTEVDKLHPDVEDRGDPPCRRASGKEAVMSRDEIAALLGRHKEAFLRRDALALAADHAPDGTFESPAQGVVKGREGIADVYRYWFTAFPDLKLTWDQPIIDGDRAAIFWSFSGTAQGPFFGAVGAGARVEMPGSAEYRFGANGIVAVRHVFDFSGVLVKTGVLKVKPV
jgi:predicted ester cyclase